MANRNQNPIDELLNELISSRRSTTSFFEDLDSASFVKGFLEISSSKLNESVRELVEFLGEAFSDKNIQDLSRRIERARIPASDKKSLGEGLYIAESISDILTDLGRTLEKLGDQSGGLKRELDFLTNSFEELKTYAGKNLREFIQEYRELLATQKEAGISLEDFINEMGGIRQFGRYFYLSRLDKNRYREESYLISQPGFFRSFEDYAKLVGPEALFKSTESLIKGAVEDIKISSGLFSFLNVLPARERIFSPDVPTITDFYRNIFRRIPQELAQAKQFTSTSLLELSERINTLLKAPESERDYVTLSKLVTQREELQKRLLALLREEVEFRQEFNRRTYGMFLESAKDFGLRSVDRILSTTRNPFVDIFTDSLRFALNIGTRVYAGTRNLLDLVPIVGPRGGVPRSPTRPSSPGPNVPPATGPSSSRPNTPQRTSIPSILRGAGRLVGGTLVGYGFGVAGDVLFEGRSLREALTRPSNIGTGVGMALGAAILGPVGLGALGAIGGAILGNYVGGLFERQKDGDNKVLPPTGILIEKTPKLSSALPVTPYQTIIYPILSGSLEKKNIGYKDLSTEKAMEGSIKTGTVPFDSSRSSEFMPLRGNIRVTKEDSVDTFGSVKSTLSSKSNVRSSDTKEVVVYATQMPPQNFRLKEQTDRSLFITYLGSLLEEYGRERITNNILSAESGRKKDVPEENKRIVDINNIPLDNRKPEQGIFTERKPERSLFIEKAPERTFFVEKAPESGLSVVRIPERLFFVEKTPERRLSVEETPKRSLFTERTPERGLYVARTPDRGLFVERTPERSLFTEKTPERGLYVVRTPDRGLFTERTPERGLYVVRTPDRGLFAEEMAKRNSFAEQKTERPVFVERSPRGVAFKEYKSEKDVFIEHVGEKYIEGFGSKGSFFLFLLEGNKKRVNEKKDLPILGTPIPLQNFTPISPIASGGYTFSGYALDRFERSKEENKDFGRKDLSFVVSQMPPRSLELTYLTINSSLVRYIRELFEKTLKERGSNNREAPILPNQIQLRDLRLANQVVDAFKNVYINYILGLTSRDKEKKEVNVSERLSKPKSVYLIPQTSTSQNVKVLDFPTGVGFLDNIVENTKNIQDSDDKKLSFLIDRASLQNLSLAALTASGSLNNLGLSARNLSINFGELAKASGSFVVGGSFAGGAFIADFYLQSMNRAYDIYYQQFVQQNLIPQAIRRQLGLTTAEISRNLVTPGTGLLYRGPLSVAGLGFERTELLAGASRVSNEMLIRNAEDLANRLKEAANVARIFGTNLEQGIDAIALLRRSVLNYSDLFATSYILTRTAPTAFTKAMAEAVIQASLSLSIQQGISPRRYLESFERIQTLFITSSNRTLSELARNNIEITRNFVNSFNEFIRSGLNNPIAGGIGIRAGLTLREMLLGATPENLTRVIRQLSLELGLPGSLVGGRFSGQAREYLLPLIQNLLGLTNISPDAFNEIVRSIIIGRDAQAQRLIREARRTPTPSAIPSDRDFARNIDQLNISYQQLTDVLERNISAITELNKAINNLAAKILDAGDVVIPLILSRAGELLKELPETSRYSAKENQEPLVSREMIDRASTILSSSTFPYSGYALVKIERVPEQLTTQFIETIVRNVNKRGGK